MMNEIKEYFKKNVRLTDNDWHVFSSKLKRRSFPKKTFLLKTGEVENYLSYVEKGIIRFYIPQEENDLTFGFTFEKGWVSAYDSFLMQAASKYHLETLTETVLWSISYEDLQIAYNETETGNAIGRYASEDLFIKKSKRELSLLNSTAEQRYLKLLTEQRHLIKEIPLKYIASFIGITPQALSRIRKRIS